MRNLISFLFCCSLVSCHAITIPVIKRIDSLKLESIDNGQANLIMTLTIENSNSFSISGKDLSFKILYKEVSIGSGFCPMEFELKSKSVSRLEANMILYIDSIPENFRMGLFEMDSISLNVHLSYQGKFGLKQQKESEVKLSMVMIQDAVIQSYLPTSGIKLDGLTLTSSSTTQSVFSGNCTFLNTLPANITILQSDINIYSDLNKTSKVGKLKMIDSISIITGQANNIPCSIYVDNFKAMSIGLGKMMNGSLDFYAIGPVQIEMLGKAYKIPVSVHFSYNPMTSKITILE